MTKRLFDPWMLLSIVVLVAANRLPAQDIEAPRVLDPDWRIELVASEPELVTPVGCCFDETGRLFVVECHTHFPPDDYQGPKADRIYVLDDPDGDGVLDRKRLFYEGGRATMGLAPLGNGWMAVATRENVVKIRDDDGDAVADRRVELLTLQTEATYPHNGLTGLTIGPQGRLYVGQGENLGKPYTLLAADGSKQVGGGEGGNVFSCGIDGSNLQRVATGFWNPFSLHFDSAGRLWTVGNDPDAMPPCRLLHVIPGGDYGFQFRFGRAGTHPLQAWNGELPGTLPMAAGTGEAPCAVIEHDGALWVTSWGSNRIERYQLQASGASWTATMEVVVQGDAMFRPVGLSVAPDGSVYFTDWVDRSYAVHGKGRLWRLSPAKSGGKPKVSVPNLTADEVRSEALRRDATVSVNQRLTALNDDDPFVRQSALSGLVMTRQLAAIDRDQAETSRQRAGLLNAWRWQELCEPRALSEQARRKWIQWGLADHSSDVVIAAVRWATERDCKDQLSEIRRLLERDDLSPRLFAGVIASIAYLETGSAAGGRRDPVREKLLYEFAANREQSARLRSLAIQMIPAQVQQPTNEELGQWVADESDRGFGGEVVRLLAQRANKPSLQLLAKLAADESLPLQVRADAIGALSRNAGEYAAVLNKMSIPRQPDVIRYEARRVLKRGWSKETTPRPQPHDLDAWVKLIGDGGDPQSGRRVFFRTTCANCHAHNGRGSGVGPDLTNLTMTRKRLLESILQPSREVGPLFVPWIVLTTDGKVLTGMKLDEAGIGSNVRFLGAEGGIFEVPLSEIEAQNPAPQSIMPDGLEEPMSIDELRDLVAFLENSGW